MEATRNNLQLMLAAQFNEVDSISGNTNRKLRIFFRMLHSIFQHLTVQHIYVQVMSTLDKLAIHHCNKILYTILHIYTKRFRNNRERITDTVL